MYDSNSIAAIVVLYQPNTQILNQLIRALSNQVSRIIFVNNSTDAYMGYADKTCNAQIEIINLKKNFGIAYAQNIGIEKAIFFGHEYVLLLDQDSIPQMGMVGKLFNIFSSPSDNNFDIIAAGPSYIDTRNGIRSYFIVSKFGFPFRFKPSKNDNLSNCVSVTFLISSGSLISISKLIDIGGMRSNYFIDHVDTEWCLRAKSKGFKLVGVHSAIMQHTLGDHVKRFWFFYFRSIAYHSPLRDYYMFRNTILMLRDTKVPIIWSFFLAFRLIQFSFYFLIFSKERSNRMQSMLLGLKHGLLNIDGEVNLETGNCTRIPNTTLDPT